jgi:hypothetical protein
MKEFSEKCPFPLDHYNWIESFLRTAITTAIESERENTKNLITEWKETITKNGLLTCAVEVSLDYLLKKTTSH